MKIGIDAFEANVLQRVGIGQYAYQIIDQLYKQDNKNNYLIFLPSTPLDDMPKPKENWSYVIGKPGKLWSVFQLPQLIKKEKLDIFFSPTHYAPWFTNIPKIISIMDLSYLHYPQMFTLKDYVQLKYLTKYSIKHARKVFTISEFSKREIVKFYKYPEKDIVVTYPGINNIKDQRSKIKDSHQILKIIKSKYILFVGTIQPRKNIEKLIEAFEQITDDADLVICGKAGWMHEPITATMQNSSKANKIKWLEFVTDEELANLYMNAICLVLPSFYEGFGIPVVEAFNYGCPVVISNLSSLPEVAGEAGIYINPEDPVDIAKGIEKAIKLNQQERKNLVDKGKKQAIKFSWENCAKKAIATFNLLK